MAADNARDSLPDAAGVSQAPQRQWPAEVQVAVVGSGFSGLGMAIRLRQAGFTDFVVLERDEEVGGTWWANTYPGCGCDVPSHLYSFSFEPNPDWTRTYSRQPEIRDYLQRCADKYGIRPHLWLQTMVNGARWEAQQRRWRLDTDRGELLARVVIGGLGPLADPKVPEIPGLERFAGATMHSARWDHRLDLRGRRVASIGTGASAVQYVPSIQPQVEQLHVFQRTAPWIFPHSDRPTTELERRLYRSFPPAQKLVRGAVYAARESNVLGFVKQPGLMRVAEVVARLHMRRQIADPALRHKVTPDYTIGCKRILPSNRWYPALQQPNVELVTDAIREVTEDAVITVDGQRRPVDTIIFGTGFHVTDMPAATVIRGPGGQTLEEVWQGSPRAYLGTAVPGFPNLFMLLGPNTGLGHNSMVYMIESQIEHVLAALRELRREGAETIEVRAETAEQFNRWVDSQHRGAVWSTGCASWYLDDTGRNATLWPDWTFAFRRRAKRFDRGAYRLDAAPAPTPELATSGGAR